MCCTRLADAKNRHLGTIAQLCGAISSQLRHVLTIGKQQSNSSKSSTCFHNMVNFGPLTAEIRWRVWGTPASLNDSDCHNTHHKTMKLHTGKRRFVAFFGPTVNDRKTSFYKATKSCPWVSTTLIRLCLYLLVSRPRWDLLAHLTTRTHQEMT